VAERYTKAIEQLGSSLLDIRVGGIYALERIARDSPRDHPAVIEVLTAFVREHSGKPWPPRADNEPVPLAAPRMRLDVQAALTVIVRRDPKHDFRPVDLHTASLVYADLICADLTGADLAGARLARAKLMGAELVEAGWLKRTSPARTSPAHSSPTPLGHGMRQFHRAGNETPSPAT
jgi:hypothetical protein